MAVSLGWERWLSRNSVGGISAISSSALVVQCSFRLLFGRTELGAVHPLAVAPLRDDEPIVILLAGRSWRVVDVDWPRRRVSVVAAQGEGRARWLGGGRPASFAVCRAAEAVIAGAAPGCGLSRRAASKLEEVQEQLPFVDGTTIPIVHNGQNIFRIWTFAGGLTNAALAQVIPGPTTRSDDFCITIRAGSDAAVIDSLSKLDAVPVRPSFSSELISPLPTNSCHFLHGIDQASAGMTAYSVMWDAAAMTARPAQVR